MDVSGPNSDDFRAKVFRDRAHIGDWRVEKLDDDGESIEIAIFSGGDARERAIRDADRQYGDRPLAEDSVPGLRERSPRGCVRGF